MNSTLELKAALRFMFPDPPKSNWPNLFTIVEDSMAKCVIVKPSCTSEKIRRAAVTLRTYLELVTGADIDVITDSMVVPEGMARIHVGDTSYSETIETNLPQWMNYGTEVFPTIDAFFIKVVDCDNLVIMGASDDAVLYGVIGFLKKYVDVRQFWPGMPGEIGDDICNMPTLKIPEIEWRDWPYFYSRHVSMFSFGGRFITNFLRMHTTLPCNENYSKWLPPESYGQSHPEYFPLISGARRIPPDPLARGWQPCVSNPEVVEIFAENIKEYFRQNPDEIGVNLSINDGHGDCECENCRSYDSSWADYSLRIGMTNRYLSFTKKVKFIVDAEFPEKILVSLAYSSMQPPPDQIRVGFNIMPVLTVSGNFFTAWDEWSRTGSRIMGMYLHHNDQLMFIMPMVDIHQMANRIKYAVASGKARLFYGEMFPQWPISGIVTYIISELLWDPRQDVDKLLHDYYDNFFGPAADPMETFYAILESGYNQWVDGSGEPHWYGYDISPLVEANKYDQFDLLKEKGLVQATAALKSAKELAIDDPKITKRIELVEANFTLPAMATKQHIARRKVKDTEVISLSVATDVLSNCNYIFLASKEMATYINEVIEKPPFDKYLLFGHEENKLYTQFKSGVVGPEIISVITNKVNDVVSFVYKTLNIEDAKQWVLNVKNSCVSPEMYSIVDIAEWRVQCESITNLLNDLGLGLLEQKEELLLTTEQEAKLGLYFWYRNRSNPKCVLTRVEKIVGEYSLMIENAHRVRLSRSVKAKEGERYHVSLKFRRNEGKASYWFTVDAKVGASYPTLSSIHIDVNPLEWITFEADVIIPPGTTNLFLRLYANGQAIDSKCWIDGPFIGKY